MRANVALISVVLFCFLVSSALLEGLSPQDQPELQRFPSERAKPGDRDFGQAGIGRQYGILAAMHAWGRHGAPPIIDADPIEGWLQVQTKGSGDILVNTQQELTTQPTRFAWIDVSMRTKDSRPMRADMYFEVTGSNRITFRE